MLKFTGGRFQVIRPSIVIPTVVTIEETPSVFYDESPSLPSETSSASESSSSQTQEAQELTIVTEVEIPTVSLTDCPEDLEKVSQEETHTSECSSTELPSDHPQELVHLDQSDQSNH